jgi:hypothetical protein
MAALSATRAVAPTYNASHTTIPTHTHTHKTKRGKLMTRPAWKTNDGRVIPIEDMTDSHLLNTEQFLRRKFGQLQDACPPDFSGEMAQLSADFEWNALQDADVEDVFPVYADICAEIKKRSLVRYIEHSVRLNRWRKKQ